MSAVSARSVSRALGVGRVRALQRVLYRCAKQDKDRRFHALYDKVARSDVLWKAWGEVRANRGAPGVDGITIGDVVDSGVSEFLDELAAKLKAGMYRPRPLRRVYIPKPGRPGQLRPLGDPDGHVIPRGHPTSLWVRWWSRTRFIRSAASGLRFCMCAVSLPVACMCAMAAGAGTLRWRRTRPIAAQSRRSGR